MNTPAEPTRDQFPDILYHVRSSLVLEGDKHKDVPFVIHVKPIACRRKGKVFATDANKQIKIDKLGHVDSNVLPVYASYMGYADEAGLQALIDKVVGACQAQAQANLAFAQKLVEVYAKTPTIDRRPLDR